MTKSLKNRLLIVLPFLLILLLFLLIANFVVYEVLADVFSIKNDQPLNILLSALIFSSFSLVISTMIGMKFYNIFTRFYSLLASVWMGYFIYLFLGSILYGLLVYPFGTSYIVGYTIIIWALLLGTYGLYHVNKIYIKNVEVHFANLPTSWQEKRVVWISDLHLGQINNHKFLDKVVQKIKTVQHDIIFIGGDLFDGTSAPDLEKFISPLKDLRPSLGIYFVAGNHEEFGENSEFIKAVKSIGITVLQDKLITIEDMQIVGLDYQNSYNKVDFERILLGLNIDKNKPSILLKHEPKDLDVSEKTGITLQLSGHTHRAQIWPLQFLPNKIYKGYSYGLKKYKNMQVHVSSGVGTWGPPMRVGTNSEIVVFKFSKQYLN